MAKKKKVKKKNTKGQKRADKQNKRAKKIKDKLFKTLNKDTSVTRHADGSKTYKLGEAASENLDMMLEAFTEFFGRPPEKGEPLAFNPDFPDKPTAYDPDKFTRKTVDLLRKSGMDGKYIYAYEQTGLLLSPLNEHLATDEDKQEWTDAVVAYEGMKKAEEEMKS